MDTLEIYWFIFFVCASLWCGAKSDSGKFDDSEMGWMLASVAAGFLAVFTAYSVVITAFLWFRSVIPSPTSLLNPITAGIFTLAICMAFIILLCFAGSEVKPFASKLVASIRSRRKPGVGS